MRHGFSAVFIGVVLLFNSVGADEVIELDTTTIRGNTELPKYLYVVPWQDRADSKGRKEQKLVLHNLYSDLFDPVMPDYIPADQYPPNPGTAEPIK